MIESLIVLLLACVGAFLSRMCGGGWPSNLLTFRIERFLYPLIYAALFWAHGGFAVSVLYDYKNGSFIVSEAISLMTIFGLVAYAAALAGKVTGHGQYLSYGIDEQQPEANNERLDFIVTFFMGKDVPEGQHPSYWRCAVGMVVTGLAESLLPGLLYAVTVNPLHGLAIAFSGAFKTVGYQVGYAISHRYGNVIGELFNGFKAWGIIAWVLL